MLQRFLTDLRFCCAIKMPTASEARDPDAYRDCSNRLLASALQHFGLESIPKPIAFDIQIVACLEIQPEPL